MHTVVERAAALGCALELNATPDRLDLNGTWARRGQRLGAASRSAAGAQHTGARLHAVWRRQRPPRLADADEC